MKKAKQPKEKFNTKSKVSEENKIICNRLFTREAVKNIGTALILDAESLVTTTFLKRRGFRKIIVPNPYVFDEIKGDKRIHAKNMLVGKYISVSSDRLTAVWLDYCCTFDGSEAEGIKPQEDIQLLFERKLLKKNSTLAVTFSSRKHVRVDYKGQDEDRVRKCIENEARINGYNAIFERTHKYQGIYFLLYHIY